MTEQRHIYNDYQNFVARYRPQPYYHSAAYKVDLTGYEVAWHEITLPNGILLLGLLNDTLFVELSVGADNFCVAKTWVPALEPYIENSYSTDSLEIIKQDLVNCAVHYMQQFKLRPRRPLLKSEWKIEEDGRRLYYAGKHLVAVVRPITAEEIAGRDPNFKARFCLDYRLPFKEEPARIRYVNMGDISLEEELQEWDSFVQNSLSYWLLYSNLMRRWDADVLPIHEA